MGSDEGGRSHGNERILRLLTYRYYRTSTAMKENIALTFNTVFSATLEVASHMFEYWTLVVLTISRPVWIQFYVLLQILQCMVDL